MPDTSDPTRLTKHLLTRLPIQECQTSFPFFGAFWFLLQQRRGARIQLEPHILFCCFIRNVECQIAARCVDLHTFIPYVHVYKTHIHIHSNAYVNSHMHAQTHTYKTDVLKFLLLMWILTMFTIENSAWRERLNTWQTDRRLWGDSAILIQMGQSSQMVSCCLNILSSAQDRAVEVDKDKTTPGEGLRSGNSPFVALRAELPSRLVFPFYLNNKNKAEG